MDNRAIGLIDSGVGGFTVLKELQDYFPYEDFIYFGDSKNLPYGEKTNEQIIELVNNAIKILEEKNVKVIILACNTASSLIKQLSSNVKLFSIIDAGCKAVLNYQQSGPVGLIATNATVNNREYDKKIKEINDKIYFVSYGTPTLAQVINNQRSEIELLRKNIKLAIDPILEKYPIKNLLLGCTHYPIVSKKIREMYPELWLINPAQKEIEILEDYLVENDLVSKKRYSKTDVFISGGEFELEKAREMLNELELNYQVLELLN